MLAHVAFAFAISFSTVKCDFWQRVNYPQPIEMAYTETAVQHDLVSCVVWCARRQNTFVVSYKTGDCFCLIRNPAPVGTVNVSFLFLKYYDYANCFDSGYNIIYPHLDFCMKFYSTALNWTRADQTCIDDGARLMTLETDAKCDIATFLPTDDFAAKIHVGGSRMNDSHFLWNTGVVIQNCWGENEPTNQVDGSENCVSVYTRYNIYLHDLYCGHSFPFLCEKHAVVSN